MRVALIALLSICAIQVSFAQFQYLSPVPGAALISPKHNIIIREGHNVKADMLSKNFFKITGALSGNHDFKMILATDGKTIVLTPMIPFEFSEEVIVTVGKGFTTEAGSLPQDFSFSFTTHRRYTDAEQALIKDQVWRARFEEATNDSSGQTGGGVRSEISGGFKILVNKSSSSPGDIFFDSWSANASQSSTYDGFHIITNEGDSVYSVPGDQENGFEWDVNPSGYLAHWNMSDESFDVLDSDYDLIDKYYAANDCYLDAHEFLMLPNGNVFLIAYEIEFVDMTVYDPRYSDECSVTGTDIQELDRNKNLIFEWRSFDHVSPDESNQDLSVDELDYVHTNSVEIDSDGNIIASHRHLDQVTKIDIQTGEFIWRMGGKMNQFTFLNDTEQFSFQHDARRLANGHITLWDDGNGHTMPHSSAKEYEIDEANHTATLVWSYSPLIDSTGQPVYFYGMGSVQRLPNGNTFIDGGIDYNPLQSNIWEVTPEGEVVWELKLNDDAQLISYRAHKRQWDPCAPEHPAGMHINNVTSRTATLGWDKVSHAVSYEMQYKKLGEQEWQVINIAETDINLQSLIPDTPYEFQIRATCENGYYSDWSKIDTFTTADASMFPGENILVAQLSPNLAFDDLNLEWNLPLNAIFNITIYDEAGREMETSSPEVKADMNHTPIDVSNLSRGFYLLELDENSTEVVLAFEKQ